MAESAGELELYNAWFTIADADKDGVVNGREAVAFFRRSGLPQSPTLFKIWQAVAGDRPSLARREFYTAMKLVSLAQRSGGTLDPAAAARLVNGLAGPVPPPTLQGLAVPPQLLASFGAAAAATPPPPAAPAAAGAFPPPPSFQAAPSRTSSASSAAAFHGAPPAAASPYGRLPAGSSHPPSPVPAPGGWAAAFGDGAPARPPTAPAFPPLDPGQAATYVAAFDRLDADKDGSVSGSDVFGAFMRSGLPRPQLKKVWDLVAGDAAALNRHQWISALYLIDRAKAGFALPDALPAGGFPPTAGGTGSLAGAGDDAGAGRGAHGPFGSAPLRVPQPPSRAVWAGSDAEARAAEASLRTAAEPAYHVPAPDAAGLAALPPHERDRLEQERRAAATEAERAAQLERQRRDAAARAAFFTENLAELRLAQSRLARLAAEVAEREARETSQADRASEAYDAAYAEFSQAHAAAAPAVERAERAAEARAEAEARLATLRDAVAKLETLDPDWERREAGEAEALRVETARLEARREKLELATREAGAARSRALARRLEAQAAADEAERALPASEAEAREAAASAPADRARLLAALSSSASVYNLLHAAAKRAALPLPPEALATVRLDASGFAVDELALGGAADWGAFKDAGFRIVAALPADTRLATHEATPEAAAEGSRLEAEEKRRRDEEDAARKAAEPAVPADGAAPGGGDEAGAPAPPPPSDVPASSEVASETQVDACTPDVDVDADAESKTAPEEAETGEAGDVELPDAPTAVEPPAAAARAAAALKEGSGDLAAAIESADAALAAAKTVTTRETSGDDLALEKAAARAKIAQLAGDDAQPAPGWTSF